MEKPTLASTAVTEVAIPNEVSISIYRTKENLLRAEFLIQDQASLKFLSIKELRAIRRAIGAAVLKMQQIRATEELAKYPKETP